MLKNLAPNKTLNDKPDQNNEKLTQFFSFRDVFNRKALQFAQFVLPVAKFIREKVEEQSGKDEENKKVADIPVPIALLTPSALKASIERRKRVRQKNIRDVKIE